MIESYSFGRIVISGQTYHGDVIIYPDKVDARWWRKVGHELCPDDLKEVVEAKPEVLIIGTGASGLMKVLPETKSLLEQEGIELVAAATRQACDAYNELAAKRKAVAALHLTC